MRRRKKPSKLAAQHDGTARIIDEAASWLNRQGTTNRPTCRAPVVRGQIDRRFIKVISQFIASAFVLPRCSR
jgi:hypothetical protein